MMEADDSVFADDTICSEEDGSISRNTSSGISTSSENTSGENTSGENTSSENTSGENTSSENTSGENTSGENTSSENTSSENTRSRITEISAKTIDKRERRAQAARELVQSQERLVDMLQSMKTDLTKMDREASHIKEDIVRSSQYFNVVVKMKQPHHLKYSPEGYNLPHSMPKVIYNRHRRLDRDLNMKYLNQLSTYRPRYPDESFSRRSSVSSQNSSFYDGYYRNRTANSAYSSRQSSYSSGRSNSPANSGFSGTESEIDTARTGSCSDNSQDSYGSFDEAGSSTESSQTADYRTRSIAQQIESRRSSYFYTVRAKTPPNAYSDEVEL